MLERTIEYQNKWYSVNNFKKEVVFIGANFNLRKLKTKDIKRMFLYTFMPYQWLNEQYCKGKI